MRTQGAARGQAASVELLVPHELEAAPLQQSLARAWQIWPSQRAWQLAHAHVVFAGPRPACGESLIPQLVEGHTCI